MTWAAHRTAAAACLFLLFALPRPAAAQFPPFLSSWPATNSYGLAVDNHGFVYSVDNLHYRVEKYTDTGAFVTQWGSQGSGDGQFNNPNGIALDGNGNVYVADTFNRRVQKFTSSGAYITQWGSLGGGDGQFNQPYGIVRVSDHREHPDRTIVNSNIGAS
jgi:DNA-binding beta-propeller fold protein YncE